MTTRFDNPAIARAARAELAGLRHLYGRRRVDDKAIRHWYEQSPKRLQDAIVKNISCSCLLSMFPYNYDGILTDLIACQDVKRDSLNELTSRYIRAYREIIELAKCNSKRFRKWNKSRLSNGSDSKLGLNERKSL